ncbi:TlpA disulfide reductase family protein [Pedobacter sp. HMWF019]|uniref:TlpA disulfide reductase family protein n=1 Tax=Pedobacter sp. HMWF019 TaxID=2056856 RepID=UPI001304C437|nr:TlpA disulfide reductase family protein [Pedobacter sp. HMWF019]
MKTIKMKWTGLVIACFLPAFGMAQQYFTLSGKIGKLNAPAKIYLTYYDQKANTAVKHTISLKNGAFYFKGVTVKQPLSLELVLSHDGSSKAELMNRSWKIDETLDHMDKLNIYVENGSNVLNSKDSLGKAVIAPSKIELERRAFNTFVKLQKDKMTGLNNEWIKLSKTRSAGVYVDDTKFLNTLNALFNAEAEYAKQCVLFSEKNPSKFYAGIALRQVFVGADRFGRMEDEKLYRDMGMIKIAYNKLGEGVKKTGSAQTVKYYLEEIERKKINIKAANFVQNTADGKPVSLNDFKGKYVFVDFWASWCGPCRGENPNVLRAYNRYKSAGLEVLGVSFDDKKEAWIKAVEEDGMPWTQISALNGFENEAAKIYNIQGIPSSLLINPEGEIIAYDLRGENLEKKLAEIFKM